MNIMIFMTPQFQKLKLGLGLLFTNQLAYSDRER